MKKLILKVQKYSILLFGLLLTPICWAEEAPSIQQISDNMMGNTAILASFAYKICFILGAILLASSIVQYIQHRRNPLQVPLSQPFFLFVLGLALIIFPILAHFSGGAHLLEQYGS